jgi:hypothetical protein
MERDQFIRGLREAADFLDAHPELEVPSTLLTVNVFVESKDELMAMARGSGKWDKGGNDNFFYLTREIGSVKYDINVQRTQVCKRVVVGTEVIPQQVVEKVEWICDEPLLALTQ